MEERLDRKAIETAIALYLQTVRGIPMRAVGQVRLFAGTANIEPHAVVLIDASVVQQKLAAEAREGRY